MKLLLDTHAFVWWDSAPEKLSNHAHELLLDSTNELFLSVASLWEIQVKSMLGKITLAEPLPQLVATQQELNGLKLIPVLPNHVYNLEGLPAIHKDPFDRLIVAQACVEECHLLTQDPRMNKYPVHVEW